MPLVPLSCYMKGVGSRSGVYFAETHAASHFAHVCL